MADWKTYVKAARNTAEKQAPEVRRAAQRATERAGGYARAAGKAVDEGRHAPDRPDPDHLDQRRSERPPRKQIDSDRFAKSAAAYATVAQRRVEKANIVPRILRALRDALLIGGSLLVIWLVLSAAGVPIPFSAVLTIVAVIVAVAFGGTLYSQFRRQRRADPDSAADDG